MAFKPIGNSLYLIADSDTEPTNVNAGSILINTDHGTIKYYNGTSWVAASGGGSGGTPDAHATSHHSGGSDPLALGSIAGTIGNSKIDDLAYSKLTSVPATFAPTAHAATHLVGGGDAIALGTTIAAGLVELATDGETASGVVVQGSDSRLSNARTPTVHATSHHSGGTDALALGSIAGTIGNAKIDDLAYSKLTSVPASFTPSTHASTHLSAGSDPIAAATESARGTVQLATSAQTSAGLAIQASDTRLTNTRTPSAHASTHLSGGGDAIASATTTAAGIVQLATPSSDTTAGRVVQASDTRLSDARTPTAHNGTHTLDTIGAGTDITTNNATTLQHGLLRKLSNVSTEYLNGQGNWTTPTTGSGGAHATTHADGGGDAFTKTTVLAAPSRYVEQIADPASDSGRIWINPTSETLEYWDTLATPVKREIVNLLSTQTIQNKTIGNYIDYDPVAQPAAPAVGDSRMFLDTKDSMQKVLKSSGVPAFIETINAASGWTIGEMYGEAGTATGLLAGNASAGTAAAGSDTVSGFRSFDTSATINTLAGIRKTNAGRRDQRLIYVFVGDISTTNARLQLGYTSNTGTPVVTDTPIANTDSAVMLCLRSTDTNYQIIHNDGTGAAVAVDTGVAKDTTIFRIMIWTDGTNFYWWLQKTGGSIAQGTISTRIPAATTMLAVRYLCSNTTAAILLLRSRQAFTAQKLW